VRLQTINMFLLNTSALSGTMSVKAPTPEWAKEQEKEDAVHKAQDLAHEDRDRKTYVNQTQYDELVAVDPSLADALVVIRPIEDPGEVVMLNGGDL